MEGFTAKFYGDKECPVCGKRFFVLYPHLWAYKRGNVKAARFFCSWKCLRAADKKGETHVGAPKKFTKQMEQEAVRIALDGRNPLQYLEEHGSTNPPQKWYEIKQKVKESDPETYAKLPKRIQRKDAVKPVETPEGEYSVADADPVNGPVTPDELYEKFDKFVEVKDVQAPKITKPVNYDGYDVTAIRHPAIGEFYYDRKFNSIDWRTEEGDEVSMAPALWRELTEQLPKIMEILGVGA